MPSSKKQKKERLKEIPEGNLNSTGSKSYLYLSVIVSLVGIVITYVYRDVVLDYWIIEEYAKANLTCANDRNIAPKLDEIDALLNETSYHLALNKIEVLLKAHPQSPRTTFVKAEALNLEAQQRRSNQLLDDCISWYEKVLTIVDAPEALQRLTITRLVDRLQFRGSDSQAVVVLKSAVTNHPEDISYLNDLGVAYLMTGDNKAARETFTVALKLDPSDGFALGHLGFVLKTADSDWERGADLLEKGVRSGHPGMLHGRFFYHLGDALERLGKREKALDVYELGASYGLYPSALQRSLYNCPNLTAQPWWTLEETGQAEKLHLLEENWRKIQVEALQLLDENKARFLLESEGLMKEGDWREFTIYERGIKSAEGCSKAPITCSLIDKFGATRHCSRGQVKFSILQPGTQIWPHCGPTNCRLRSHLGLVIPPNSGPDQLGIRVGSETRTWQEGKVIVFDDSFEHAAWHFADSLRLVLIVDLWHPEVTENDRRTLAPI